MIFSNMPWTTCFFRNDLESWTPKKILSVEDQGSLFFWGCSLNLKLIIYFANLRFEHFKCSDFRWIFPIGSSHDCPASLLRRTVGIAAARRSPPSFRACAARCRTEMEFSRESQAEKLLENNMGIHDSSCLNGNIIGKYVEIWCRHPVEVQKWENHRTKGMTFEQGIWKITGGRGNLVLPRYHRV